MAWCDLMASGARAADASGCHRPCLPSGICLGGGIEADITILLRDPWRMTKESRTGRFLHNNMDPWVMFASLFL